MSRQLLCQDHGVLVWRRREYPSRSPINWEILVFEALSRFSDEKEIKKRILVYAVTAGLAIAVVGLVIALYLGVFGYDVRRMTLHEAPLHGGLREKAPLVASPQSEEELEEWLAKWGDQKKDEILQKGRQWPITRIFDAGDMIYFIFFDEKEIMRGFVYINAPEFRAR